MKRVIIITGAVAILVFVFVLIYFETRLRTEREDKGQQMDLFDTSDEAKRQPESRWWETREFMLTVEGPFDGLDVYLNGIYTGKRTPARFEVKPNDFVVVKGKPASERGVVGAWLISGKEEHLMFSTTEFEKGWQIFVDTGPGLFLDGLVFKDSIQQKDFDAHARFGQFRFITVEKCPNLLSLAVLADKSSLLALCTSGSAVRDFSAIATLDELRSLLIANSSFSETKFLTNLTNLLELDLGGTLVYDVEALSKLTNLRSLSIYGAPVEDITPILSLGGLRVLDICSTPAAVKFKDKIRPHLKQTYSCACCGD